MSTEIMKMQLIYSEANSIRQTEDRESPTLKKHIVKWKRGELIGEGAYAKVYQCMNLENGELMAIKRYKFSEERKRVEREFQSMKREINLLRALKHPNIVKYI